MIQAPDNVFLELFEVVEEKLTLEQFKQMSSLDKNI
jgi:hypothetical protein